MERATSPKYFKLPNPGLRAYFQNVLEGQPDVVRAPFANKGDPATVLSDWDDKLRGLQNEWPTLYEYEKEMAQKVGPMSVMKPLHERVPDVLSYYEDILLPHERIHPKAIDRVRDEWINRVSGLRLRNEQNTVNSMKLSTNSGSPYFIRRRNALDDTIPCRAYLNGSSVLQYLHGDVYSACAVLGWRGQEGGPSVDDVKQRVVWMFPFAINILELQLYQPAIQAFQQKNLVPAWNSMDAVDLEITKLFRTKNPDDLVVCTDFTRFDQHFNYSCQDAARTLIAAMMVPRDQQGEQWIRDVFPIKYMIPIALQENWIKTGNHGMASGSGGTNFDETIVHRALQHEAAISQGKELNPHSMCLGDDGVLSYPGITVDDVMGTYVPKGLDMNKSKQYVHKHECIYLRRWHNLNYSVDGICRGVYSTNRALGRLMYQERFYDPEIWNEKMVALRQLSIIENCKWHPMREQFAEFCIERDKYRLGLGIPGFLEGISSIAREAIELMPDFLGYTKSLQKSAEAGINDWWIVKYLKSK